MKKKQFLKMVIPAILLLAVAAVIAWAVFSRQAPAPVDLTELPPAEESALPSVEKSALPPAKKSAGQIYLYGEIHASEKIMARELELWRGYYEEGMRDLFIELSYYTAEYLNIWMRADDDTVLDELDADWEGTVLHENDAILAFYHSIKRNCPETVFHGTDVGHQFHTTGQRYLAYLEEHGEGQSEEAELTRLAIEQGRQYYDMRNGEAYRENQMVENFIREFNKLSGKDVMGIYGAYHTGVDAMSYGDENLPCMANQLSERYGALLHTEDLSALAES